MFAAKASILVGLKRIFDDTDRGFVQWSFIVLIALNGAFYFATFISFIAACVPRAKITDPTIPGTCIASNGSILATSVCNILSDFAILILPISVVWSLQMPLKMKMTVVVVFATGLLFV
jgi:hypothetical protein